MRHTALGLVLLALPILGCEGAAGANGEPGQSCSASTTDGVKTVTCPDGSTFTIEDGTDGTEGTDGADGESCSVVDNGDGSFNITCTDGTDVVLNDPGYVPAAYTAADGLEGGLAYSKWWVTQAGGDGNLAAAGVTVGAEWVRCKTCHAWDGRGNAASYANRTGQSTGTASRPDVSTVDLRTTIAATTPQQLFDLIRGEGGRPINTQGNGHPDYSASLDDAQVWNLVKFMREEWIFPDTLYRLAVDGPPVYTNAIGTVIAPTLTFYGVGVGGNAVDGNTVYTAACTGCHNATGTNSFPAGASAGELARTKPHEVWHKVKFGEISDTSVVVMAPGLVTDTGDLVDLYKALADTTAFPDAP